MLDIKNIYKTFNAGTVNEKRALNGVNLHLAPGDFVTVIGGNGAGKSTTLNAVAGTWLVDEGPITIDGIFGPATRSAVLAAQRRFALPQTGVVDARTWDEIYDQFSGIETVSWRDPEDFPYTSAILGQTPPRNRHTRTTTMTQFPGTDLRAGNQDAVRQEVVR